MSIVTAHRARLTLLVLSQQLAVMGDAGALTQLLNMLQDRVIPVQQEAAKAISQLKSR
ncbi:MAG: hypothetical protein ACAI44_32085 [Candidatus Sericytochromatia bacterium]